MEPENGKDILFGTCNIVAIIGSCFFIASESRLMKKDKLTISSGDYNKIWKLHDTLYLTMTGSKSVVEKMKIDTKNYLDHCEKLKSFPVFKDAALNGFQYLKKIAGDNKRPDFTEDQLHHWVLKYQNAASFFCSFVDQKPVIYRVCVKNENNAPIDVSILAENDGFDFLGSSIIQARKYLVEIEFFRRCEKFEKDGDVSVGDIFVQFVKNYFARANSILDSCGQFFWWRHSRGSIGPKFADLGKVKEIFSKVRRVGCFGFPAIEYKCVRVSGLFPGSNGVPIKILLCGNCVAGWV